MRSPVELDAALLRHQSLFGKDPLLISFRTEWHQTHIDYFAGRIHQLCCGKGYLFNGVPLIITSSPYIEDFIIGY